jgi:hypothetical protein
MDELENGQKPNELKNKKRKRVKSLGERRDRALFIII